MEIALHPLPVALTTHAPLHRALEASSNATSEPPETPLVAQLNEARERTHGACGVEGAAHALVVDATSSIEERAQLSTLDGAMLRESGWVYD